jgi:DNA-binding transcriptional regulator YhcF (GntR family)
MRIHLDPNSPVPLYHQIAEAIRYRIATGQLAPGASLPSLREGARAWGVNLHTIRHAYKTLAEQGYVTIKPPLGAVVARGQPRRPAAALGEFLDRTLEEARDRHGLSPERLAALIAGQQAEPSPEVSVVECSDTQCAELAEQIESRWRVRAAPWSLASHDRLPPGDVVATYFHYNDVRRLAPARLEAVRFLTIRPDDALAARVKRLAGARRRPSVVLVERDESMARSIAADVSVLLAPLGIAPAPLVVPEARDAFAAAGDARVLLFSPRAWGALSPAERLDRRALEVRYVIDAGELDRLGPAFGWSPR